MLLEARALLAAEGPLGALHYLEAHAAAACSNSSNSAAEGMQRHLRSTETQQLLAAARAAASTAAARMQDAVKGQDLSFGLTMELLLMLLQAFYGHYTSSSASSSASSSSSSSSISSDITALLPVVEGGALLLTHSPEEAATVAAALTSVGISSFSLQLLQPPEAEAAAAAAAAGDAPRRKRRKAATMDDRRTSSSTRSSSRGNNNSSSSSSSPFGNLSRPSATPACLLQQVIEGTVFVADCTTAARCLPCCCRWRLVVMLIAATGKGPCCFWGAHRFSAACADGLFLIRQRPAQQHIDVSPSAFLAATTAAAAAATSASYVGGSLCHPSAACGSSSTAAAAAAAAAAAGGAAFNWDGARDSMAAPLALEDLRTAARTGGPNSLVASVTTAPMGACASQAAAAGDELFAALQEFLGSCNSLGKRSIAAASSSNCCNGADFVASSGSALLLRAMHPSAPPAETPGEGLGVPTGCCVLLPRRRLLPLKGLFAADWFAAEGDNEHQKGHRQKNKRAIKKGLTSLPEIVESSLPTKETPKEPTKGAAGTEAADLAAPHLAAPHLLPAAAAGAAAVAGMHADQEDERCCENAGEASGEPGGSVDNTEIQSSCIHSFALPAAQGGHGVAAAHPAAAAPLVAAGAAACDPRKQPNGNRTAFANALSQREGSGDSAAAAPPVMSSGDTEEADAEPSSCPPLLPKREHGAPTDVSHCGQHTEDPVCSTRRPQRPGTLSLQGASIANDTNSAAAAAAASYEVPETEAPTPASENTAVSGETAGPAGSGADSKDTAACSPERITIPVSGHPTTSASWPSPPFLSEEELHAALADDDIFSSQLAAVSTSGTSCLHYRQAAYGDPVVTEDTTNQEGVESLCSANPKRIQAIQEEKPGSDTCSGNPGRRDSQPVALLGVECPPMRGGGRRAVARLRRWPNTGGLREKVSVTQLWWLLPDTEHPLARLFF